MFLWIYANLLGFAFYCFAFISSAVALPVIDLDSPDLHEYDGVWYSKAAFPSFSAHFSDSATFSYFLSRTLIGDS